MFKKADIILIVFLLILSTLGIILVNRNKDIGSKVEITVNNEKTATYSLYENKEIMFQDDGYNKIIINNGTVYVESADCPDKICVNHKKIKNIGETIVCLPHKLVIKIK